MRVLLIHQVFVSPNESGGTRHYELARYCIGRGQHFTIVASDLSYVTGQRIVARRQLVTEQHLDGIRILRAYTYPSLHRSFLWRTVSFLSFMVTSVVAALCTGPIDLVIGTSPPIFQAVSAWLVARLRRRPFLLEIRDLWPEFAIDIGVLTSPLLIRLSRWLEHWLYARASHLLVNSPAYRDYLLNKGIPAEKITLIPNGVEPDMFDPASTGERIRQEWGMSEKFIVTYAGSLGLANDIPTILKAAEHLRDLAQVHFFLVGDGKERHRLEMLAQQNQLSNVTFAGSRPKREMAEILAASDVCVATLKDIPMFRTTYPNKVFDYMAAGRPTILAIDGVIRDVVEAAQGGVFVPPGDGLALAEAVRNLEQNRSAAREMGQAARSHVVHHFDRRKQAHDFLKLVEQLGSRK